MTRLRAARYGGQARQEPGKGRATAEKSAFRNR